MNVEFRPHRRLDGKFAIEVFRDDVSLGFIQWIETTYNPHRLCLVDRADIISYPRWTKIETQANCNWLNQAYLEGKIK